MNPALYGPIARMLLNTIGSILLAAGIMGEAGVGQLNDNPNALMIATGIVGMIAQYGGWVVARARGWAR